MMRTSSNAHITRRVTKVLSGRRVIGLRRSHISNVVFLVDKQTNDKKIVFIFR